MPNSPEKIADMKAVETKCTTLYAQNLSTYQISERTGWSQGKVARALRRAGVAMRRRMALHLRGTALTAKIRVAVPCSTDPQSVEDATNAIHSLVGKLPQGSTLEFIGEPAFGRVPKAAEVAPQPAAPANGDASRIPEHMDRRVPRHDP